MDKTEARSVLAQQLAAYRRLSYAELARRVDAVETAEVTGPSGVEYQLEIQVFWDDRTHRDIRVMASIDDGRGLSAFVPLCDDFIMAPDGSFVGE